LFVRVVGDDHAPYLAAAVAAPPSSGTTAIDAEELVDVREILRRVWGDAFRDGVAVSGG
jgi:hypothetical protein